MGTEEGHSSALGHTCPDLRGHQGVALRGNQGLGQCVHGVNGTVLGADLLGQPPLLLQGAGFLVGR